jgi:hypothetical protein
MLRKTHCRTASCRNRCGSHPAPPVPAPSGGGRGWGGSVSPASTSIQLAHRQYWERAPPARSSPAPGKDSGSHPAPPLPAPSGGGVGWGRVGIPCEHEHSARSPAVLGARASDTAASLPQRAMHYPQLVSTTCVPGGMIAIGAVVGDWPGGSAPLQPCQYVLDWLPYARIMRVSRSLECGSHAAAPAVLTIRRGLQRTPVLVRDSDDGDG